MNIGVRLRTTFFVYCPDSWNERLLVWRTTDFLAQESEAATEMIFRQLRYLKALSDVHPLLRKAGFTSGSVMKVRKP